MEQYITKRTDSASQSEIDDSIESYEDTFGIEFIKYPNPLYVAPPAPVLTLEQKEANMRTARNNKLKETDFTQLADSPFDANKKAEYATYRQALRDLPENITDIDNITWPVKPV